MRVRVVFGIPAGLILLCIFGLYNCGSGSRVGTGQPDWRNSGARTDAVATATRNLSVVLGRTGMPADIPAIRVLHPFEGAVFPRDMAAPDFVWQDPRADASSQTTTSAPPQSPPAPGKWLVSVTFESSATPAVAAIVEKPEWIPSAADWERIKIASLQKEAVFRVAQLSGPENRISAVGRTAFSTSPDAVEDAIMFHQAPLPFFFARDNPTRLSYRVGRVASYREPRRILGNRKTCGNCHTLHPFRVGQQEKSLGYFQRLSPDRLFEAGVARLKLMVVILHDWRVSEFAYQLTGAVSVYDHDDEAPTLLPGASDPGYVQTHPAWSPDGRYIYFARAPVNPAMVERYSKRGTIIAYPQEVTADLNRRFPVKYDLFRVPFNGGRGGTPEPLKGASGNGFSHSFPRVSPDGKWVVFTRQEFGFMLQPSSRLFIIPAAGGQAREMRCNRSWWNSYHAFSPNGKWMIFTSKTLSPYTQIFLTHLDEQGRDTVPVRLTRFHIDKYAALLPEFVKRGS